jgi:glucan phosphoethanolaminetransferase (alkaline phosphatase superfamily)
MIGIWDKIPQGFRERPFDAYTALALIAVGFYGLIDPRFPEDSTDVIGALLFTIIEIYFIVASVVMLLALLCNSKTRPTFSYLGQMYAWAFIAAAGIAVMTFQLWINIVDGVETPALWWLIFFIFGCVGWAAFFRSMDMYLKLKKLNKEKNT